MKANATKWGLITAFTIIGTLLGRAETSTDPSIQDLRFYAGMSYSGAPGKGYEFQYSTNLQDPGGWITLTNVILDTNRLFFVDLDSPLSAKRFYRLKEVAAGVSSASVRAAAVPGDGASGLQSILSASAPTTGWGVLTDPDHDCKVGRTNGVISIEVPGTAHDFAGELEIWNAPRILTNVEGNFVLEVTVSGSFQPGENSTISGRRPYHGAGLLLVQDQKNHLSLQRASVLLGDRIRHYANFELRHGPDAHVSNYEFDIQDKDVVLRLARTGNKILAMASQDGINWRAFNPITVDFSSSLSVGVEGISSSQTPLTCSFKGLTLYGTVEDKGDTKGPNVTGTWQWVQGGGQNRGKMDLVQTAGGRITGRMYDTTGGLGGAINGTVAGNEVEFTRSWTSNERQYHLVLDSGGNTLTGRISGIPDPTTGADFTASR